MLGALLVLSPWAAAACASGGENPDAVAHSATPSTTPSPAPTSDLLDGNRPSAGLRPATTASPEAARFEWTAFVDEPTGTSAALPEGAEPIANPIPGPAGRTIMSRGFVHEHADGVLGFEVIDEFATLDDLRKMAELLAISVGGTVGSVEEIDAGQANGIDGEISYGDDQLMLFRILVLNGAGDVWNGFVGGPAADRTRLESEFSRLMVSVNLRPAFDWVSVTDEPSGITVSLPGPPYQPAEQLLRLADGVDVLMRKHVHADSGSGFAVIDTTTETYDPEQVADGLAYDPIGTVLSTEPVIVRGMEAVDAVIVRDSLATVYRFVELDGHLLLLYSSNRIENQERAHELVGWLTDTVVLP